jgi:hypothetical protein
MVVSSSAFEQALPNRPTRRAEFDAGLCLLSAPPGVE